MMLYTRSKHLPIALIALLFTNVYGFSQLYSYDTRVDSIDILHVHLDLDITDFAGQNIAGRADLEVHPLVNTINSIRLDLMTLTIDSVHLNGSPVNYTTATESFLVNLGSPFGTNDTFQLAVWYHGHPHNEPNFGGFHFASGYAYNIGVAFQEIPHNFGRTWYPCFDNFIERSTYSMLITTDSTHKAIATGLLSGQTDNGDGTFTWNWSTASPIPSYLVSVAVSNFETLNDSYTSNFGPVIPVLLAAKAADTADVTGSFVNLFTALDIYEDQYGPYVWERVGYCILPVAGGAMEHATNISYPTSLTNGNTLYQDVMAHELSHHWWGDLITCRTAEDMWINEGMAVYSEYVFNEFLNGTASYRSLVRTAHKTNLHLCHINDNGYWPLSGVPQSETYGYTTYPKGADMVHTLRTYLGDSLFFTGLKQLLVDNAWSDIDAAEFRDDLSQITGVSLTDYFDTWIFQAGWPHVGIDSVIYSGNSAHVYLKQKLVARTQFSQYIPITITFFGPNMQEASFRVNSSGEFSDTVLNVGFSPVYAALNLDEKISHAVTAERKIIKTNGLTNLTHANFSLTTNTVSDSVLFIVEHNWAKPDTLKDWTLGLLINLQRYWRIGGVWNGNFDATGTFSYNGKTSGNGYLDNLLITGAEDSLVLVYRSSPASDWTIVTNAVKNMGSPADKIGSFTVTPVLQGEYTFAMKGMTTGVEEPEEQGFRVSPNPTRDGWNVYFDQPVSGSVELYGVNGQLVKTFSLTGQAAVSVDSQGLAAGQYYLRFANNGTGKRYSCAVLLTE